MAEAVRGVLGVNVFVLCTGRCGSSTFARACRHIDNYTVGHETAKGYDLEYPQQHVEVDNRLAWFLGRLAGRYPRAYYVHLLRNREEVAGSFARRGAAEPAKLLHGFMRSIKQGRTAGLLAEAFELVDTVDANLREFLQHRPHVTVRIEDPAEPLKRMWREIRARGDLAAAMAALDETHNRGPR